MDLFDFFDVLLQRIEFYHTKKYKIHLVDRGGGGASFSAALIYGIMNQYSIEKTGDFLKQ